MPDKSKSQKNRHILVTQSRASLIFLYQDTFLYITTYPRSRKQFYQFLFMPRRNCYKIALFSSFVLLLVVLIPLVVCHFTTMHLYFNIIFVQIMISITTGIVQFFPMYIPLLLVGIQCIFPQTFMCVLRICIREFQIKF